MSRPSRLPGRSAALTACALAVLATTLTAPPVAAAPVAADPAIRYADSADAVPGRYVVALRDNESLRERGVGVVAEGLAERFGGTLGFVYAAGRAGFSVSLGEAAATRLAADPAVAYVEQDRRITLAATQRPTPSWGLDRSDQRTLPLNSAYTYPTTASNVHAYVIDTGLRITHNDFGGRAVHGYDFVDNDSLAADCNGHGTHVAGTVGGAAYGVAKGVQLVGVRVLDCAGNGFTSGVAAGVDWVTANAIRPAVANMSLGGGPDSFLDDALRASIQSGVTYTLAAGNDNYTACSYSPGRVAEGITVGSTNRTDGRSYFSNYGSCVDLFAPGEEIISTWYTTNSAIATLSGTSMAAPHVAGAAAVFLARNTGATPAQVRDHLVTTATSGRVGSPGSGSPNRLLYVQDASANFVAVPQAADFDGDGRDDLAARSGQNYSIDINLDGQYDLYLILGLSTDASLVADVDGDGFDDLGLRRGTEYLFDTNVDGVPDSIVRWGRGTDGSFVGDLDGNGTDDLVLRRDSSYFIDTTLDGQSDRTVGWGRSTDQHLVGDFNGDGVDDLALRRDSTYYVDFNLDGRADDTLSFGRASDSHFVGDFNADGRADLGLRRGTQYFLDYGLDGASDRTVTWGRGTDGFVGRQAA